MAENKIDFFLSGGAANADVNLSVGGVKSSVKLVNPVATYSGVAIAGVALKHTTGVSTGVGGTLWFDSSLGFAYQSPTGAEPTINDYLLIETDGDFILMSVESTESLTISVIVASVPTSGTLSTSIDTARSSPNLYENVLEPEALTGSVKYRHLYMENISGSPINCVVYLNPNYPALDLLAIGFSTTISGQQDELLLNDVTAPMGVTFNTPSSKLEGITLEIAAGESIGMYLERTVEVLSDISNEEDSASIIVGII